MDKAVLRTLDESTRAQITATSPTALRRLDENGLGDLLARIRRERNKYTLLYRRQSGEQVRRSSSRGIARPKFPRTAAKAELYEDALARVSDALAAAARKSAAQIRAERLKFERASTVEGQGTRATSRGRGRSLAHAGPQRGHRTPISRKRHASSRAAGARKQATPDT